MNEVCKVCGKKLKQGNSTGYCHDCLVKHRQEEKLKSWLSTGKTGYTVDTTIRVVIRNYILDEQEHKCAICGLPDWWNGGQLHFILDHIDGDAGNSSRGNLRLICPNCDSQLDTYKSRNKNSARRLRKEFLKNNTAKTIT